MSVTRFAALLLVWNISAAAAAQAITPAATTYDDGPIAVGGDVAVTFGSPDPGWFDFTDYGASALRQARVSLSGAWRPTARFALLGGVRAQTAMGVDAYGLYARIRPWPTRRIDIQVGRIPPVFGSYSRRAYGTDNPLIGIPLAYQYLTTLRTDAAPASADDLLRMRGRGWLSALPLGAAPHSGLPLVNGLRWDTGAQVRVGGARLSGAVAVTVGSLSNPRTTDDNGGRQIAGRVEWRPAAAWLVGASGSRGAYATRTLMRALPPQAIGADLVQRAGGADVEYSRAHWVWRNEAVLSAWDTPRVRVPYPTRQVRALALASEGRCAIVPGAYAAARVEHLGFSRLTGTATTDTWDANVTRVEVGGGYALQRHLLLKAVYQRNWRDGGRIRGESLGAAQLLFWF